jgi:hypothetical protein
VLEIERPNASKEDVDVGVHGTEFQVLVCDAQRKNSLPDSLVGRIVASARLAGGVPAVIFEA